MSDVQYVEVDDGVFHLSNFVVESGGRASGFEEFVISATGYAYSDLYFDDRGFPEQMGDSGTVSITPAIATAPEPSSFLLLGTGLFALPLPLSPGVVSTASLERRIDRVSSRSQALSTDSDGLAKRHRIGKQP